MPTVEQITGGANTQVQTVDSFILIGLQKRFHKVFNCPPLFVSSTDKAKTLEKAFEGKPVSYPYAFLTVNSFSHGTDSYNGTSMSRHGLVTNVSTDGKSGYKAKVLPASFEIEVEYVAQSFDGSPTSILGFARNWLFARRGGWLKFQVEYGRLDLGISVEMSDNVSLPKKDGSVNVEQKFELVTTMTVHGFVSYPILMDVPVAKEVQINGQVVDPSTGKVPGMQFMSFARKWDEEYPSFTYSSNTEG